MASLGESLSFLRQFLTNPEQVGAVLPSSDHLAKALTVPLSRHAGPVNILEIGAGTGAVTREIAEHLGPHDRLDICESNAELARHIEESLIRSGPLRLPQAEGRVRLFSESIQAVQDLLAYDYVISGLPFTACAVRDVMTIMKLIRRHARPQCVFSYFEYIGIRPLLATIRTGRKGRRFRVLSAFLTREISLHQIKRTAILRNIPPAYARHLQFPDPDAA